jgi:hypothetical protein
MSEELTMTKSILVSLAILTLSTSVALAAQRTHHSRAMNPSPYARPMTSNAFAGVGPSPVVWQGGVSSSDRDLYFRNLRDSGYNLKNNRNSFGNVATQ